MKNIYSVILIFLFLGIETILNAQTTWYLKNTGNWNVATNWTQDPAAAITVPSGGGVPSENDNIVIPSGKTVTLSANVTTSLGTVSIYGDLDMATFTINGISMLKGNGRLLMADDHYPIIGDDSDFVTKGRGEGTVVFYGSSGITLSNGSANFFNVEVNLPDEDSEVRVDRNIDINGSLNVKSGRFKIGQTAGVQRIVNVFGDINVFSGARLTEGGTGNFHWLNVYGDFTNNGLVDFARQPQYTESTGGAVKLRFRGTTDNVMVINGRTDVYRLFIDKGTDKTYKVAVNAISDNLFNLYGPVSGDTSDAEDGGEGWQRLPIVIENGTLELGAGITIGRLGESISGAEPNEFSIPSTGSLWVNGATVSTSSGSGGWRGLSLFGTLKVSSGSLITPAGTGGIAFGTQSGLAPEINVEGGDLYLTQIRNYYTGNLFSYVQSGGEVHFFARPDNTALPTFYMEQSTFAFNMSGGQITFAAANNHWQGDFYIAVADENYSFTGGTVEVQTLSTGTFDIYSVQPLYNLSIVQGVGTDNVRIIDQYGGVGNPSYLKILNDLTVGSGAIFDDSGYDVTVGGDFNIAGTYTQAGALTFDGNQDGVINNLTGGTLNFGSGLTINKDRHPSSGNYYTMSVAGNNISVTGNVDIERGGLDVVDYWPTVSGNVIISDGDLTSSGIGGLVLTGSDPVPVLQGKLGKEFNFGNIRLNNGNSGMSLATDVNVEDFEFVSGGSGKVNMGTHNLTVTGSVTNASSTQYFYTAGNASDGGLTLGFTVPNSNSTLVMR
ncbi:G8 domain-containing protein [Plebeiibacterium sediminum]|uniref:G8 domain-containing protein n=1 Tax=Plebeiibacterium sediminum TaxID=2992112 RepID=A0AAE3M2I4_9BACT|nr:G8 domain-containing protein [Plebeiobacterium sediminum]MCW3785918.1 G8 domain-containing protein [Plebeiobacterium sediminum]